MSPPALLDAPAVVPAGPAAPRTLSNGALSTGEVQGQGDGNGPREGFAAALGSALSGIGGGRSRSEAGLAALGLLGHSSPLDPAVPAVSAIEPGAAGLPIPSGSSATLGAAALGSSGDGTKGEPQGGVGRDPAAMEGAKAEKEREAARSAASTTVPDLASLLLPGVLAAAVAPTPPAPLAPALGQALASAPSSEGAVTLAPSASSPEGSPLGAEATGAGKGVRGRGSRGGDEEGAPGIGATSGGAASLGALEGIAAVSGGSAGAREKGDDGRGDRPDPGASAAFPEAALVADRPAGLGASGGAGVREAKPLTGAERARVVHQVVARVAAHAEGLAVARSREPLTIRLEPADLGRIVVTVARDAAGLSADLRASDPRVAEALDRHRSELTGALAQRGHAEARVTVQPLAESAASRFDFGGGAAGGGSSPQGSPRPPSREPVAEPPRPIAPPSRRAASGLDLEI